MTMAMAMALPIVMAIAMAMAMAMVIPIVMAMAMALVMAMAMAMALVIAMAMAMAIKLYWRIIMIDFNVRNYLKILVPAGRYKLKIKNIDIKPTKDTVKGLDTSKFLQFSFQIASPYMQGQMLFDNMNIYHSKENVAIMGRERLATLCEAISLLDVRDINDFIGKEVDADIVNDYTPSGNPVAKIDKYIRCLGIIPIEPDDGYSELMR